MHSMQPGTFIIFNFFKKILPVFKRSCLPEAGVSTRIIHVVALCIVFKVSGGISAAMHASTQLPAMSLSVPSAFFKQPYVHVLQHRSGVCFYRNLPQQQ